MQAKQRKNLVFIGDIHGRDCWKEIVARESDADVFVFFGDYFDAKGSPKVPGPKQLKNFFEIIEFKRSLHGSGQEAILLFGNHDFHYMPWYTRQPYSGYLPYMAHRYGKALQTHLPELSMAYAYETILCTHAGVSWVWLNHFLNRDLNSPDWKSLSAQAIGEILDQRFREKPLQFDYNGFDPFGDDPCQSPIWLRPKDLEKVNRGTLEDSWIQVFGHSVVYYPEEQFRICKTTLKGRYFHTDMLAKRFYLTWQDDNFQLQSF